MGSGVVASRREGQVQRDLGRILEQTWIWSVVGYSILRFAIAWGAFGDHGASPWIFGILDVGTAWPYAKAISVVCKRAARSQWSQLPVPIAVALTSFFAPYVYLWFAAGSMPAGLRAGMAIFVSVLLIAATLGTFSKIRSMRRSDAQPADAQPAEQPDRTEVVIDLRNEPVKSDPEVSHHDNVIDLPLLAPNADLVIDLRDPETIVPRRAANG